MNVLDFSRKEYKDLVCENSVYPNKEIYDNVLSDKYTKLN